MKATDKMLQGLWHSLHQFSTHLGSLQFLPQNDPISLFNKNNSSFPLNKGHIRASINNTSQVHDTRKGVVRRIAKSMKLKSSSTSFLNITTMKTIPGNRNFGEPIHHLHPLEPLFQYITRKWIVPPETQSMDG